MSENPILNDDELLKLRTAAGGIPTEPLWWDEDILQLLDTIEYYKSGKEVALMQALELRIENEALKAQVATLYDWLMVDVKSNCFVHVSENYTGMFSSDKIQAKADEILPRFMPRILRDTQATAETFIADVRKAERDKTIRECIDHVLMTPDNLYQGDCSMIKEATVLVFRDMLLKENK